MYRTKCYQKTTNNYNLLALVFCSINTFFCVISGYKVYFIYGNGNNNHIL